MGVVKRNQAIAIYRLIAQEVDGIALQAAGYLYGRLCCIGVLNAVYFIEDAFHQVDMLCIFIGKHNIKGTIVICDIRVGVKAIGQHIADGIHHRS